MARRGKARKQGRSPRRAPTLSRTLEALRAVEGSRPRAGAGPAVTQLRRLSRAA
ncbi:MAG TPA: hypothetical protein VF731_13105 [Solirubrobacterales bacterium]